MADTSTKNNINLQSKQVLFVKTKIKDTKKPMQNKNHAQPMATRLITNKLGYKLAYLKLLGQFQ